MAVIDERLGCYVTARPIQNGYLKQTYNVTACELSGDNGVGRLTILANFRYQSDASSAAICLHNTDDRFVPHLVGSSIAQRKYSLDLASNISIERPLW